ALQPSALSLHDALPIYLHAARADTFPNTVLEALACATPVVATAVGGIPEQVKGLEVAEGQSQTAKLNRYSRSEATGILVPAGDRSEEHTSELQSRENLV